VDIFAANLRTWAASKSDVRIVEPRIGFGWAAILTGIAMEPHADRMRRSMLEFQTSLQQLDARQSDLLVELEVEHDQELRKMSKCD